MPWRDWAMDLSLMDRPYENQTELLQDALLLLDARMAELCHRHALLFGQGALQGLAGLVVTKEDFQNNLEKAAQLYARGDFSQDFQDMALCLNSRVKKSRHLPLLRVTEAFALEELERACLLLALASQLDAKYEKLFGYLQDDVSQKLPGLTLAVQLFAKESSLFSVEKLRLKRSERLLRLMDREALEKEELRLKEGVFAYLLEEPSNLAAETPKEGIDLYPKLYEILRSLARNAGNAALVILTGKRGAGKRQAVLSACRDEGKPVLHLALHSQREARAQMENAVSESYLRNSCLMVTGDRDALVAAAGVKGIPNAPQVFLLSEEELSLPREEGGEPPLRLHLPEMNEQDRNLLFRYYAKEIPLAEDVELSELSAKFLFTPLQIRNAFAYAKSLMQAEGSREADGELLHRCCYDQVEASPEGLLERRESRMTLDDLVLPASQKNLLRQAMEQVKNRHQVYVDWGFAAKLPYGRGVSILLSGPPGTGKTMGAQIVAEGLHMHLERIQLSQVVSKYIGETEKNLRKVFEQARESSAVLFFDECDALFSKRSEVKDAQDRHANAEVAYLLQQMEEHDGVTILATNLLQNIDSAFMRRMRFVVHFPFPDKQTRETIFKKLMPKDAPLQSGIDFGFLAEKFPVSGGNIKNIVLHAAFLAAADKRPISMGDLLRAAVEEQRKNEIVVVREDLREYADLLEGWWSQEK